tara:strand:+ start:244 stop:669 length:426 start_codon:yes stop_codon:yes gene_type:complete
MQSSVAAIIYHNDGYLLQKRDKKKSIIFPNFYSLFGGIKKKNESSINAIRRELLEETNIKFKKFEKFLSYEITNKKLKYRRKRIYFICKLPRNFKKNFNIKEGQYGKFYKINKVNINNIVPWDFSALIYHQNILKNKFIIK